MESNVTSRITSYLDWSNQGKSSLGRYILGALFGIITIFVLGSVGAAPVSFFAPDYQESLTLSVLADLMTFVIPFFVIPLIVKILHARPTWSVALPRPQFQAWHFLTGFWVYLVVGVLTALIFSMIGLIPIEANPDFELTILLPIGLIGLVGIFFQAGSEELLFRGYFMQFTRRFTSNKYLFIAIPALLFALPHILNIAEMGGGILLLMPYLISGLLLGWIAYRTGSLWMALGLHFCNNYMSLVLIGTKGDVLPTAAPFQVEITSLAAATLLIALQSVVVAIILAYLIRRREARA